MKREMHVVFKRGPQKTFFYTDYLEKRHCGKLLLTSFLLFLLLAILVPLAAEGYWLDVYPVDLLEPKVITPCDPIVLEYYVETNAACELSLHTGSEKFRNYTFSPSIFPVGGGKSKLTIYLDCIVSRPHTGEYTLHVRGTITPTLMIGDDTKLYMANMTVTAEPEELRVRRSAQSSMRVNVLTYPLDYPPLLGGITLGYELKRMDVYGLCSIWANFSNAYFYPPTLDSSGRNTTFYFGAPSQVGRYCIKFGAQYGAHYSNLYKSYYYFIDVSDLPEATTHDASDLGPFSVALRGSVNPMYSDTTTYFQWGTTTAYGNITQPQTIPKYKTEGVSVTHYVQGLIPNTRYHYRIVASNEWGAVYGENRVFITPDAGNSPPHPPHAPSPANGATLSSLAPVTLLWEGGDPDPFDVATYDVYFGITTPPPLVSEAQLNTSYDPGALEDKTIYNWKIISCDSSSMISEGPQWKFALDTSIVLSFLCEDNDGFIIDVSGNDNNGTVNGAVFLPAGGILNSNAYQFNWSSQDNIQVPYQESQTATEALTLEAWVYPTAWDNTYFGYNRIVSKQPVYLLRGKNNGCAHFQILTANHGYQGVIDSDVMSLNEWHYVVGTFDGRYLKLYVDGTLRGTTELPEEDSISTNEADIFVGESPGLAEGFTGTIDNVAIYKRARLQSEIQETYASIMLRCEGDFDYDGDVDGSDLAVFAADFGRTDCDTGEECKGDFDKDGDVDGNDLALFAADFGRTDCPN